MSGFVITCTGALVGGRWQPCDATEHYRSVAAMKQAGWADISQVWPDGLMWTHVGQCPECVAERHSLFAETP